MQAHCIPTDPRVYPESGTCIIYSLADPRSPDQIRYIGMTTRTLHQRVCSHVATARRRPSDYPVLAWIRELLALDLKPAGTIIEITRDKNREYEWIRHYERQGLDLLNCVTSGEALGRFTRAFREKATADYKSRTHCPHGHAYEGDNVIMHEGSRHCRACMYARNYERKRRLAKMPKPADRTHCPQGHEYTEENTERSRGKRTCRTCRRERDRIRKARKLEQERAQRQPPPPPTHCGKGHEYTPENLRITKTGQRVCKACHRTHARNYKAKPNFERGSCAKGHPYDGNLLFHPSGGFSCRQCSREYFQAKQCERQTQQPRAERTHCKRGHALRDDNLLLSADGHSRCRACRDLTQTARRERGAAAQNGQQALNFE